MPNNSKVEVSIVAIPMVPLTFVHRLIWNPQLGSRLRTLRGEVSRRELVETLTLAGVDCTQQTLYHLERGDFESISVDLAVAICENIGASISQLFPTYPLAREIAKNL